MSKSRIQDYKTSRQVCKKVYTYIKDTIVKREETKVVDIIKDSTVFLEKECKRKDAQVAFPICISLNNCLGYYIHESNVEYIKKEFEEIQSGDVVKVEFGVVLNDARVHYGETFILSRDITKEMRIKKDYSSVLKKLNEIPKKMCKKVKMEDSRLTNDDVANFIAGECTKFDCYPAENIVSYKTNVDLDMYETDESQIILGFSKKVDETGEWILLDNPCCDIEQGDVYNLNITIVPEREEFYTYNNKTYKQNEHIYTSPTLSHVYRLTGLFHNFKLKSVKEFFNLVKKNHSYNAFDYVTEYQSNPKYRIGLSEMLKESVMTEYPIRYIKNIEGEIRPVFFKKITFYMDSGRLHLID